MKAISKLESGAPVVFECEICSTIEDVCARSEKYKNAGYELAATLLYEGDNAEDCCLYSYEKLSDTGGSVKYLFKDTASVNELKQTGRTQDLIEMGLINDFIHFTMLSRSGFTFNNLNELFEMMDDCEEEGVKLDLEWL